MKWILLLGLLFGCDSKQPIDTQQTNNQDYNVAFLFEHDGCKIYRFHDFGDEIHFVKCDKNQTTSKHVDCGKNCTKEVTVETEEE